MFSNDITDLCRYSFNCKSNKSYCFTPPYINIKPQLETLKKKYPFNVYIIDCAEYYSDENIVKMSNSIINRNKTLMNDYMNLSLNESIIDNTETDALFKSYNSIFIVNINSCEDDCKNIIPFMNSITERDLKSTYVFFMTCVDYKRLLYSNCGNDYDPNDFLKVSNKTSENEIEIKTNVPMTSIHMFKNYKLLSKYKKYLFPLNKIKITKKRIEKYINTIVFIDSISNTSDYGKLFNDYKTILIDYLTDNNFDYSRVFNVSHYDNIPLILYENIDLITYKSINVHPSMIDKLRSKIRRLCINYYCYTNDPDMHLFKKSNLYYFLYMYKKQLLNLNIIPIINKFSKLNFTKYYSNRAAEIQYQKML